MYNFSHKYLEIFVCVVFETNVFGCSFVSVVSANIVGQWRKKGLGGKIPVKWLFLQQHPFSTELATIILHHKSIDVL